MENYATEVCAAILPCLTSNPLFAKCVFKTAMDLKWWAISHLLQKAAYVCNAMIDPTHKSSMY
jgi:hypothetical protein